MAILLVYTVCFILIVLYDPMTCQINRILCLETALAFVDDHKSCDFDKKYAHSILDDNNPTCQTKCEVKIENVDTTENILREVDITFGSTMSKYVSQCPCKKNHNNLTMFIDCTKWNKVNVPVGGYCKLNEQCQYNELSGVCKHGRCMCRTGYVLFNLECHEGNLTLNQPCSLSEQCAGSPYASCLRGKCSCIEGYTAENSTYCIRSKKITLPNSLQNNQGATVGALFGGLLLGVILTKAAVMIFYRRSKKHVNKREELNVKFSDSYKCCSAKVVDHNTFQNIQTTDKKQEESPYSCLEETSIFNHASRKSGNGQTLDDVYNNLHEQDLILVLYDLTTCQKIKRTLCLETAFAFVDDHNNCDFDKEYAQNSLYEKNPTCQTKCKVKIDEYAKKSNVLWEVDLSFGSAIYRYLSHCPGSYDKKKVTMSIDCPKWNTVQTRLSTLPNSVDHQANIGSIFGALFGGLLLGVILTTADVVIIYRRSNTHVKNREERKPTFADNYSSAKVVDHSDLELQDFRTKNITQEVSPYSCLGETSVYDHASEKPINGQTQNDVYNHLHGQVKQDDINYYDHACASSVQNGDMGDYSHLRQTTS